MRSALGDARTSPPSRLRAQGRWTQGPPLPSTGDPRASMQGLLAPGHLPGVEEKRPLLRRPPSKPMMPPLQREQQSRLRTHPPRGRDPRPQLLPRRPHPEAGAPRSAPASPGSSCGRAWLRPCHASPPPRSPPPARTPVRGRPEQPGTPRAPGRAAHSPRAWAGACWARRWVPAAAAAALPGRSQRSPPPPPPPQFGEGDVT